MTHRRISSRVSTSLYSGLVSMHIIDSNDDAGCRIVDEMLSGLCGDDIVRPLTRFAGCIHVISFWPSGETSSVKSKTH